MNIHSLFILRTAGTCLYNRNFTKDFSKLDKDLVTPFFSAIFSFAENVITRKLEELEMSGLRFAIRIKNDFIFVLLADTSVSLLYISSRLDKIIDVFFRVYEQLGNLRDYQEIDNPKFDDLIDAVVSGQDEMFRNQVFYEKIINFFKTFGFKNDITSAAVLSTNGKIIYSSLPNEILLKSLKELEIRFISGMMTLPEMYYSLENGQKVFSTIMKISHKMDLIIVLLFDALIPLGLAELNLKRVTKRIKELF